MNKTNIIMLVVTLAISAPQAIASKEKWYTYWSLGISDNRYPSELQSAFDEVENEGFARTEISLDYLGFYWPIKDTNTIHGFVISDTRDTLSIYNTEISFNTYLYSYSTMIYFGEEPGDGFFLRGDVGLAKTIISAQSSSESISNTSDWGNGFLFGVGYGIPADSESRVIIGLNTTFKEIENDTYSATVLSIGGLW